MTDDAELLRRYTEEGSADAFGEIVQRHLGLVHHAALRQTGDDPLRTKEVAQAVFTALTRRENARAAQANPVVWLHAATRDAVFRGRPPKQDLHPHGAGPVQDPSASWDRLRPVIDEALSALPERDREAVLLRYFEDRPFAEIGDRLFITEDAARVRTDRAVERLQAILAQLGFAITAHELAHAMERQAGPAAPAGMSATIAQEALRTAGSGRAGRAPAAAGPPHRLFAIVAGVAALAAMAAAIYQTRRADALGLAAATAQQEALELRGQVQRLELRLETAMRRAQAADEDNARLLDAMDRLAELNAAKEPPPQPAEESISEEGVNARFQQAVEAARAGRMEEALRDFLWVYDEGMPRFATYQGIRNGVLLSQLADLARRYPPAREALRLRRERAEQRMRVSPTEREAAQDFAALNEALGDGTRTLTVFDRLRPDDARRQALGQRVFDPLVERQRYRDATQARPYAEMRATFELAAAAFTGDGPEGEGSAGGADARATREQWVQLVQSTARDVEALAGAGALEQARELAVSLLALDSSTETRAVLQERLARAGQPDLLRG